MERPAASGPAPGLLSAPLAPAHAPLALVRAHSGERRGPRHLGPRSRLVAAATSMTPESSVVTRLAARLWLWVQRTHELARAIQRFQTAVKKPVRRLLETCAAQSRAHEEGAGIDDRAPEERVAAELLIAHGYGVSPQHWPTTWGAEAVFVVLTDSIPAPGDASSALFIDDLLARVMWPRLAPAQTLGRVYASRSRRGGGLHVDVVHAFAHELRRISAEIDAEDRFARAAGMRAAIDIFGAATATVAWGDLRFEVAIDWDDGVPFATDPHVALLDAAGCGPGDVAAGPGRHDNLLEILNEALRAADEQRSEAQYECEGGDL